MCNSERGTMKRTTSLLALLGAGLVTVLAVAGFSIAAGDAAPTNQSPPTISGTTTVGSVLTASSGSWNGTTPITYAYQWRRCGQNGGSCSNIGGGNKSTYTLEVGRSRQHPAGSRHREERRRLGAGRVGSDHRGDCSGGTRSDRLPGGYRPDEHLGCGAPGTASDRRPGGVADHGHPLDRPT